jgi:hypothetical protein
MTDNITAILGIFTGGWSAMLPYIIGAIGAIGVAFGLRHSGKIAERNKNNIKDLTAEIKAERDRANAETDAAAGGAADRLHDEWQRK